MYFYVDTNKQNQTRCELTDNKLEINKSLSYIYCTGEGIPQCSVLVNRAAPVWPSIRLSIKIDLFELGAAVLWCAALLCYFIWKAEQQEMKG